jgi:lipoprotein-anchoring transpeptidase ErfK/SrfK
MTTAPKQHHRIRILLLLLLLLALLGVRALGAQGPPMTSAEVRAAADTSTQLRVVVSLAARRLWVIAAEGDTMRAAAVAVGSGKRLTLNGKSWQFVTPVGVRRVLSTEKDPVWIRPDWAYVELAREKRLRLDSVTSERPHALAGGDSLVVRGREVGALMDGAFEPWPYDQDIIIGGVLYMPPLGSPYRVVAGTLGKYRLNLGNGIGFHGTLDTGSVGKAVTHGCMRLYDGDVEWLFLNVPVGTPVFIY